MMRLAGGILLLLAALASVGSFLLYQPRFESGGGAGAAELSSSSARQGAFAADRDVVPFDPARAMKYLDEVCKIGPRVSGTDGMKKQQEMLRKHFEDLGGRVEFQRFTAKQKSQRQPVEMANLIVSWHPERLRRVILCSHYDTRPIADREADRRRWREPFLSANDGGSGVALLMELANHLNSLKTGVGVDLVFFDGEEYVFNPVGDLYFFGSEHFAQEHVKNRPRYRYSAAVLLDMIGGKDAHFPVEQNSMFKAGALVQEIWQTAAEQNCKAFSPAMGYDVRDDHLALNKANIPAVDIIDFDYPHWHLLSDVPANCSGDSLGQVARVLTVWLQRQK
jgi:hypothetical protein